MFNIENNLEELIGIQILKKVNKALESDKRMPENVMYKQKDVHKAYLKPKDFDNGEYFDTCHRVLANYEDTMHHPDCF